MIAHVSTVHPRNDTRIFLKEIKSISKKFPNEEIYFLVADGLGNSMKGNIFIVDFGLPKNRFSRFILKQFRAYKFLNKLSPTLIHIHDPELLIMSWALNKSGNKVIYDAHEDYRIDILSREWIPGFLKRITGRIFGLLEDKIIEGMSGVVSATPSINERMKKSSENSIVVNNYPLSNEFSGIPCKNKIHGPLVICYVGAIAEERGLTEIVNSLTSFNNNVILELGGTFSDPSYEKYLKSKAGWECVKYHGQLSRDEMKKLFTKSSIGIVTYHPIESHLKAQPNKLFDYLSAGLPVLCSNFEHWKTLFLNADFIYYSDPKDIQSIKNGIKHFIANANRLKSLGENGRNFVQNNYSWESEEKKLINFYSKVIS